VSGLAFLDANILLCSIGGDLAEAGKASRFSYWDSAILAAANMLGCDTLPSEDLDHARRVNGTRIANPFRDPGPAFR